MADNQQTVEIELALTGLVKLMKAMRFYPKEHPSLKSAIDECMAGFAPMLARPDNQAIQANQNGFSIGTLKIGEKNPALPDLARMLAERRVNQLIFLPDLPPDELMILLEGLAIPAEEIYRLGGLPIFLSNHQTTTIWLNESSLDGAMQRRQQLIEESEQPEAEGESALFESLPPEASDIFQQIAEIIQQLNSDQEDDAYRLLIDQLLHMAPAYFDQNGLPEILQILPILQSQSQQEERPRSQRSAAAAALERLLSEKVITLMLTQFKRTSLTPQQFQNLQKFIIILGIRIAPQLLTLMSKEEDATVRKRLNALLGKMGEPLLSLLHEMTLNNKWYVVRNAVTLFGDLRLDAGHNSLAGLTTHPDQRVRRALIRSLAMIGGQKAVAPLLELTQDPATALRRPAVIALGATKSADAVQPLLQIARSFDPFGRQTEIRSDAISALGILGSKEAISPLLRLVKRPNIFKLQRPEELRAEIIITLGKLGGNNLEIDIKRWQNSPHGVVQRAAALCLTNLTKKHDNSSTD